MAQLFKNDRYILMLLSIFCFFYGVSIKSPSMENVVFLGWLCWLQLFISVYAWTIKGNKLLSPYIIFLIALYIFSNGQSFLWSLGVESERDLIGFHGITVPEIFNAQVLTMEMLAFFQIGASTYFKKQRIASLNNEQMEIDVRPRLKQIGWLLFFISVVPYVSETINDMVVSLSRGYGAIYGAGKVGIDNLSGFISDYFMPSIICLFVVYSQNRKVRMFLCAILLMNIIAIMIIGGRSNAVILIALLLILYHYLVKSFTRKWFLVGIAGVFLMLQVLAFVGRSRIESNRSADITETVLENNAAVDAVAEMGSTMYCLIKTMGIVPAKSDYRYGRSYAFAFTTIIPNLGFWDIHPAKKESNLGDWLTEELSLGYGTGFSMCAEAYINFGYFAFVIFFIWGYFISSIFSKIEPALKRGDYALLVFMLILFWFFLKLPRNNFINLVRPIFFVAGPIYFYCKKFKTR